MTIITRFFECHIIVFTFKISSFSLQSYHCWSFSCENMHQADLSSATVVYLYGTCLKEEEIIQLAHSFKKLPEGAKIITVSYPLSDYVSGYVLIEKLTENFPWGKGDIFLQKVEIPSSEQPFNFRLK